MVRGLYIAVGVLGLMMAVGAGVTAAVAYVPPGDTTAVMAGEVTAAAVGLALAAFGLVQARTAGEYDLRRARPRPADPVVPTPELAFDCPSCGRLYRASGQVAGRPFTCRRCDARFTIPDATVR